MFDIEKLPQLDRIEFRQKWKDTHWNIDLLPIAICALIIACIFGVGGDVDGANVFFTTSILITMIHIIFLIINFTTRKYKRMKLLNEYFEIKPKGKSK